MLFLSDFYTPSPLQLALWNAHLINIISITSQSRPTSPTIANAIQQNNMSESPKMTKAQKIMAKMGYQKGQGLGKDGEGMVDPIQESSQTGRVGLGHGSTTKRPAHADLWTAAAGKPDLVTRFISIGSLPQMSKPSVVHTLFGPEDNVVEVFTPDVNPRGIAWVEFATIDDAAWAASQYDGSYFGPNSQKVGISLIAAEEVPVTKNFILRYSDFVREQNASQPTSTVLVTNLPTSRPIGNVKEMVDDMGMADQGDIYDSEDDEEHGIKHIHTTPENGVLVQFQSKSDAGWFRDYYNGTYWKNNTLHVNFRPDAEMTALVRGDSATESIKLFVGNVRGLFIDDIRSAFHPIHLADVQINHGGFAFIFLATFDAITILDKHSNGKKLRNGRKIFPKAPSDKKDVAKLENARKAQAPKSSVPMHTAPMAMSAPVPLVRQARAVPIPLVQRAQAVAIPRGTPQAQAAPVGAPTPAPTPAPASTPNMEAVITQTQALNLESDNVRVKIANLPGWTTEGEVRNFFHGFQLSARGITIKRGYGFVSLTSKADAQRAVDTLHKSRIQGQVVNVKLAET
jgi:RNA recognition motif-containing protein